MNCQQTRYQIDIHPEHLSDTARQHLEGCSACQAYHAQQQDFDQLLDQVAQQAPPSGLRQQLLLQGNQLRQEKLRKQRQWGSIAAGLLIGVLLLGYQWFPETPQNNNAPVVAEVLEHVYHELDHLHENRAIKDQEINYLLRPWQGSYSGSSMKVNYAGSCEIASRKGIHLVVEGEQNPVTVLLMPGTQADQDLPIQDERFQGRVFSAPYGSFAVLGEDAQDIHRVARQIKHAVDIGI